MLTGGQEGNFEPSKRLVNEEFFPEEKGGLLEKERFEVARFIGKWIIYIFAWLVLATSILAFIPTKYGLISCKDFISVISPFFLPIMTLVLGYFLKKSS